MRLFFTTLFLAGMQLPAFAATGISCPATAMTYLPQATETLNDVMVMNAPAGDPMDNAAWPSLVPDRQTQTGDTLLSTWQLYADGRNYLYCAYGTKGHFLLYDVGAATYCQERITSGTTFSGGCK